ncbi:MAG: arginine--tRNA ligase [Candidatus Aminicenantes bacterium]|nr:arginine--tRNA ligase [Candidatus Aminicenantes bacterium]
MITLKKYLKEKIYQQLKDYYPVDYSLLEMNYTPDLKMGDLALTFPFHLAKELKKKPREIAQEIAPRLSNIQGVDRAEVAGPGYINLFLNKSQFLNSRLDSLENTSLSCEEDKIIVEHTNINPNKAAHIGHLRNAVLGDTLARCLKSKGEKVEIQNYIDDTGVQVVDVIFGFMEIEKKNLSDIKKITEKFDYYCWDLYSSVSSYLKEHLESTQRKAEILKKVEKGESPEADIAHYISRNILRAHLKTMERIDVTYDVLPCESTIIKLKFWEKAFELLKKKNAVVYITDGINKGCWVMKLEDAPEKEKIIVRSDGTVTYVGKDIAYQLWKFGLLKKDFYYEPFTQTNGKTIWITTETPKNNAPHFGNGSLVYNVIDTRQSYLQNIVVQGLKSLKYDAQAEKSIHFSYEMVALSLKSLKELKIQISDEDKGKNFLEVSGRKGLGIKADDLLDRLEEKAFTEVKKRNPELTKDQKIDIAHKIACGALRYFILKFTRNSLIIFDFEEALSFEGETGPYLQYTLVRIQSIFRKLKEKKISFDISPNEISFEDLSKSELNDFWEIIFYASQFEEEVLHSIRSLEFSNLAKFTFILCQKFNAYYHKYSILSENNKNLKNIRIFTIHYIQEILKRALFLMGIPQPERM